MMITKIMSTCFTATVAVVSATVAVWLTLTGHTLQSGGLLIAMGGVLGAVIFGFRLAQGFGSDRFSIWAGPFSAIPPAAPAFGAGGNTRPNTS